ncbi:putative Transcription antitermination protein RfaH [Nitrospira japonica]|uniref:Putative Transcription antitermination protein RfaH n=1 Tax=Nitrospira japonica TaxID=1325564 RepID=A0A1W1IB27_9BACT|nr:transcription termination/antitermination NusG family protein [Nitrospira japonica]SLM50238.1 putative Transcription antitermination protein RfaH [Nitrospira japonica]
MEKWYAIMAKPKQEYTTTSVLRQVGIDTYYPEIREVFNIRGQRRTRPAGLFPGYFFAKFDYDRQYRIVSYCRGVRKIVMFGSFPAEVESSLLDEIKIRLERTHTIHLPSFKPGEIVQINHGPLAGIKGIFGSSLPSKERVVVLLRTLLYQSRAVIQLSDIEKFPEAV